MKAVHWIRLIVLNFAAVSLADEMSFSDDFEGLAAGDLAVVSSNWTAGPWSVELDVVDRAGDTVVRYTGRHHSMALVDTRAFNLVAGQDLAITNSFTSSGGNWLHGVVLNYTRTTTWNLYSVYMTRDGARGNVLVNIDKWVNSNNAGSGCVNLLSVDTGCHARYLKGNGTMVVTYDADQQTIGVNVAMESGLLLSTNLVDAAFSSGQVGIYASKSDDYIVSQFSVAK